MEIFGGENVTPLIICFEGLDGSGKSTAIQLLKHDLELENYSVKIVKMIGNKDIKRLLSENRYLTNPQRILILRAAFDDAALEIDDALSEGSFVLLDRGLASYFAYNAYGASYNTIDQQQDLDMVKKVLTAYPIGFTPDITFYLKSNYETMVERHKSSRKALDAIELTLTEKRYRAIEQGYHDTLVDNLYSDFINFSRSVYEIDATYKPNMVKEMIKVHLSDHF